MKYVLRMMFFLCLFFVSIPSIEAKDSAPISEAEQMRIEQHIIIRNTLKQRHNSYRVSKRVLTGYAPHYGKGVMERVSRNRKLPLVKCMVSSPYEIIGTWLEVKSLIDQDVLVCRVTDVSADKDRPRHIKKHWAVELDFTSAKILCNIKSVGEKPARACPVEVRHVEHFG